MTNHWPILAATVVVAGTIAVGTYRREELMNAAATPAVVKPLQVQEVQRPPTGAAKPAEASLVATASAAATPPAAASTAPKPKGVGSNPAAVLAELRGALQGALKSAGKASTNATSEAFSMTVDGARVEVLGTTNWSIAIYNENKKAPQTETSSFKAALETVTKTLKLELAQAPTEDAAGRKTLTSGSRIGMVTVVRDPALGNACFVRPVAKPGTPPAADKQAKAAKPAVEPLPPAKAPVDDSF